MAVFTAVNTDGETRWNQWKTWAAADPGGGEGSQYPGAADSFVVPNTKTVLVNGQYPAAGTIGGGDCSVSAGGTLTFDHTANTRLTLGAVNFTNSGTVNMGTAANPIGAAYTCEFLITPATDGAKDFITGTAGVWNVYGHASYYGNLFATYLGADWNGAAATIVVRGDWSSIPDNTEIWIHKNRAYNTTGYTNDLARCFVNTTGGATPPTYSVVTGETTITIDGLDVPGVATSTWLDGGRVVCMSRNVTIGLASASRALSSVNANRPDFTTSTGAVGGTKHNFHHCEFIGLYLPIIYNATSNRLVFRNGRGLSLYNSSNTDIVFAENEITPNTKDSYYDYMFAFGMRQGGIPYGPNNYFDGGEIFASVEIERSISYSGFDAIINSFYMFANSLGVASSSSIFENCHFGYNSLGENLDQASNDFIFGWLNIQLRDTNMPASISYSVRNALGSPGRVVCHDYDQTVGDHRILDAYGSIALINPDGAGDAPSVARTGGHTQVLECLPLSNCNTYSKLSFYGTRMKPIKIWGTASVALTLKLYIQSEYEMTGSDVKLFARYLNASSDGVETNSTETIAARTGDTDWTQYLSVTFTPGATGWVELWAECYKYSAAADYFYVDPLIDGVTAGSTVRWENGYPVIQEPSGGSTYKERFMRIGKPFCR